MTRLDSKIALVSGSARGIGLAIAQAMAREGAQVVIADLNTQGAEAAADAIERAGGRATAMSVDVSDPDSILALVAEIERRFGRIDILVNNAGIGGNIPFLETSLADWQRIVGVNLTGAFVLAQAVARIMVAQGGGKIVNIVSISGQRGGVGRAAYGAAKAGLDLLGRVMAVELAPHNINVNSIAPGAIETEMAKFAHDAASRAAYTYLIPTGRYGAPEDIADAAVFLASEESRYIHGHTLNVDGGFGAAGLMFGEGRTPPAR